MPPISTRASDTVASSRPVRRTLVLTGVLVAAGAGVWLALWPGTLGGTATGSAASRPALPPALPVVVQRAVTADVPIYLDGLGTVQASATVTVRAQVDGTLQTMQFREGQDVRAGDVLGRIDARTFQATLDAAVAHKQQDQANLANLVLDFRRYEALARDASGSAQQADTAKAAVAQLAQQVLQDQAQIDRAQAELSFTTITAPIAGRIGMRQVDAGNVVHAADPAGIVVITTLQPISVLFTLPQQRMAEVQAAMRGGPPEVLALPQGDGSSLQGGDLPVLDRGRLAVLDNQIDQSTGTLKMKSVFPNTGLRLWPGAFVTVRLLVETRRGVVTVPPVAIQRGPGGAYVYVVQPDQTALRRDVTVGHQDQATAIVEAGLAPGETVVTDGAFRLSDGARVSVVTPVVPQLAAPPRQPSGTREGDSRTQGGA